MVYCGVAHTFACHSSKLRNNNTESEVYGISLRNVDTQSAKELYYSKWILMTSFFYHAAVAVYYFMGIYITFLAWLTRSLLLHRRTVKQRLENRERSGAKFRSSGSKAIAAYLHSSLVLQRIFYYFLLFSEHKSSSYELENYPFLTWASFHGEKAGRLGPGRRDKQCAINYFNSWG